MRDLSEYARRCKAIDLLRGGHSFTAVARAVGRCRAWVAKWSARYRRAGRAGLRDQGELRGDVGSENNFRSVGLAIPSSRCRFLKASRTCRLSSSPEAAP